jgi:pilus assembly protein CpaE
MTRRVIIISPDVSLASSLREALASGGIDSGLTVLGDYPAGRELKALVDSVVDPTVFIVALSEPGRAIDLIERLQSYRSDLLLVAADWTASPEAILGAMRAGASEFLVEPFEVSHLRQALESKQAGTSRTGRLLCVLPAKEGSGASTLAMHLAGAISGLTGEKTLLVDFDFHCGATAYRLRLKPEFTFVDALSRAKDLDEIWPKLTSSWGKIDLLAPPPMDEILTEDNLRSTSEVLASAIRSYPYTLVDLSAAVYTSCRSVLKLAHTVYLVATPEMISLHLARRRIDELIAGGLNKAKIRLILGRAGSSLGLSSEDVARVVGLPIYHALPNDYAAVSEAALKGGLVRKQSRLSHQIAALAGKITGRNTVSRKKPTKQGWQNFFHKPAVEAPSIG